jgi:hypothetical protein
MYVVLAAVTTTILYTTWLRQPIEVTPEVRKAYQTVEHLPKNKIVLVSIWWGPGTVAENRPQMEAIVRHCFKRGVPVVILPWDQVGSNLAYNRVEQVAKEMGKVYGKDWAAFGFRPAADQAVLGLRSDFQGTFKRDRFNTPLSEIPVMKNVKNWQQIGAIVETTPSGTVGLWINFIGQPYKIPIIYCPTGVMVPEGYNFLDAGQIKGMLPGLIGAAKYEYILKQPGFATRAANALSASHVLIILLIILGNLGYIAAGRRENR